MRIPTTILIGAAAGILGFDGPLGIVFFFAMNVLISCLLVLRFGFQPRPYFKTLNQIFKTGLYSNVMTFMVTWVFFHNIVYIL